MGYSTDFSGGLSLSRPATAIELDYINKFSETRRMKRDVNKLMELYQGKHGHPTPKSDNPEDIYGADGAYFNNPDDDKTGVIDYNTPPGQSDFRGQNKKGQPGLWCQWEITPDGTEFGWNGAEKFYNYVEWLKYLINNFFEPWGIKLNGEIFWEGEDHDDQGKIIVTDNVVKTQHAEIIYRYDDDED